MGKQWYYYSSGERQGPVSGSELKALADRGELQPDDLVWTERLGDWQPAKVVKGLFSARSTEPPLLPNTKTSGKVNFSRSVSSQQIEEFATQTTPNEGVHRYHNRGVVSNNQAIVLSYARISARFVASILDALLLAIGIVIICLPVLFVATAIPDESLMARINLFVNGAWVLIQWLYYAVMESSPTQGTLGKMALGIKVTDMEGNRISFARATGRFFGKFISSVILGLGWIMAVFTERKQALHDIMSGCLVVSK